MRLLPRLSCVALLSACTSAVPPNDASFDVLDAASSEDAAVTETGPSVLCSRTGRPSDYQHPSFARPSAAIELLRDELGVMHVYARNDLDGFYGSGYAQAVDRLFQMELLRRSAHGTLAEVLGREKLSQDQLVRMLNIPHWGRVTADRLRREHPADFALVVAWVAGVNRRIQEIRQGTIPRPPGFRPSEFDFLPELWTPDDPSLISRLLLFRNASQLEYDLLATIIQQYTTAGPVLPLFQTFDGAYVLPPEERPVRSRPSMFATPSTPRSWPSGGREALEQFVHNMEPFRSGGSNNWALAGRHSFNGRPLLAGDPHQQLLSPAVFWAHHLHTASSGGAFDVIGFSFVGTPGVQLGHNASIGWTATTAYPDMMDLFEVRSVGNGIRLGTQDLPVERCTEMIRVKGADSVAHVVEDVPGYGVLLPRNFAPLPITQGTNRILFRWTGFRPTNEAEVFFSFDRASSTQQFDAAARSLEMGAFNFVAADARSIAYRSHVLVPERPSSNTSLQPYLLLDGSNVQNLWSDRFVAADRQPHSSGGERGFLFSANNDPFGFTATGNLQSNPWYYGVWFDPGTRARRIETELTRLVARGNVTREELQTLQLDTHNTLADALLPVLFSAMDSSDAALAMYRNDAELRTLRTALESWNRRMERTSGAALVFEAWQHFFARAVLADDLGPVFESVLSAEPVFVLKWLSQTVRGQFPNAERLVQEGRDVLALRALAETRTWLRSRFQTVDPAQLRWQQFHRTRFNALFSNPGPFDGGTLETDGAVGTINVSQAVFFQNNMVREFHESRSGAVYRMVLSFREDGRPEATVNFVRGNAGDPTSPYWANTAEDWLQGRYRSLPFERTDVERSMRERMMLMP